MDEPTFNIKFKVKLSNGKFHDDNIDEVIRLINPESLKNIIKDIEDEKKNKKKG
jgi:hypothetical protein